MTGNTIFERALSLCGLRGAGAATPADLADLEVRGLDLLNELIAENTPLNSRVTGEETALQELEALTDTVSLCGEICAVLAYGLGALLIAEEDPSLYTILDRKYKEARKAFLADGKANTHAITEVYG